MRRALIALVMAIPLMVGTAVAQADFGPWGPGTGQTTSTQIVAVAGTVVSVDPSSGTFVANASAVMGGDSGCGGGSQNAGDFGNDWSGPGGGGACSGDFQSDWAGGPGFQTTPTQVTITTNGSTTIRVDGQMGTITSLGTGDRFVALFNGSPGDSLQTIISSPALAVYAHMAPPQRQLYAFVGTVNGVDTTAGTVSVKVTDSIPSGFVPTSSPATFTVSPDTLILGGNATNGLFGGSLNGVSTGDMVAGGLVGTAGETLAQVEATPLQVLLEFPVSSTSTTTMAAARQTALSRTRMLLGFKAHRTRSRKRNRHHARRRAHSARALDHGQRT